MEFANSLVKGALLKRYKRFLADVALEDGKIVTAHCANPGSMMGLKEEGMEVYLSPSTSGKLSYKWELARVGEHLVGINTSHPNRLVEEALNAKVIEELSHYTQIRREVKYGKNSRVDFVLESEKHVPCYLEVKNVHLKRYHYAEFPDSITERGTKHLMELANMVRQGARAVMLYVVQRGDCDGFQLAADIDPKYAETSAMALRAGVERLCYYCDVSLQGIKIAKSLKIL